MLAYSSRRVVLRQRLGIQVRRLVGIDQLDATPGEHRLQLFETGMRLMVTRVTQEQHAQFRGAGELRTAEYERKRTSTRTTHQLRRVARIMSELAWERVRLRVRA